MTALENMTDEQFERFAFEVLERELGAGGLARFLRLYRSCTGDFTREREEWQKNLTVDQILHSIRNRRQLRMSDQAHRSDPRILNQRTLERNHRRLATLLGPGMSVLDVGCGTGAITAGIARSVGPQGRVVGIDRDESLLQIARQQHNGIENLSFENKDVLALTDEHCFDIVTSARALQWVSDPATALVRMKHAARPGGYIVVLDYNHDSNSWEPEPPASFLRFYRAFLDWRKANGWENRMADSLPHLFRRAGIQQIEIHNDDEIAAPADPDSSLWTRVIESLGPQIAAEGFLSESGRLAAEREYRDWVAASLQKQTLQMRTVIGKV